MSVPQILMLAWMVLFFLSAFIDPNNIKQRSTAERVVDKGTGLLLLAILLAMGGFWR